MTWYRVGLKWWQLASLACQQYSYAKLASGYLHVSYIEWHHDLQRSCAGRRQGFFTGYFGNIHYSSKMRFTLRLLANVKPGAGRYLEPGNPTGLTGLMTHPSPRSTLLYLYSATLDKLQKLPDHSVYRQSTEALTRHRMRILENIKPAGWEEWAKKAQEKVDQHPEIFRKGGSRHVFGEAGGNAFIETVDQHVNDDLEWDGERGSATLEGTRSSKEGMVNARMAQLATPDLGDPVEWEPEPPLEASQ